MTTPTASSASTDTSQLPLPPGSFGLPLVGEMLAFLRSPADFLEERRRRHGNIFRTHLLGHPTVVLLGPEAVRWIFAGENKYLRNRWTAGFGKLLGVQSLAMLNGESHLARRRMLAPHYTPAAMRDFVHRMETLARRHLERWAAQPGELEVTGAMRALVFEVIITLLLGETEVDQARLSRLFQQWSKGLVSPLTLEVPFTTFGRAMAAKRELMAEIEAIVARRERLAEQPKDVLGALLSARDEQGQPLAREALVHELHLQLFAGHDTTVTALSNLVMLLAQHPEVLERCRQEQQGLAPWGPLSLEAFKSMPYLHQVLQEVMRLIPPVGGAFRVTTQEVAYGGYRIPKGWTVSLSIRGAHYGPPWTEPQRFDPERMGPERGEHKQQGALIPFGGGARVCLGQHLALAEMAVVVALLLRGYHWELVPGQDLSLALIPVPLPRHGLRVRFSRRSLE